MSGVPGLPLRHAVALGTAARAHRAAAGVLLRAHDARAMDRGLAIRRARRRGSASLSRSRCTPARRRHCCCARRHRDLAADLRSWQRPDSPRARRAMRLARRSNDGWARPRRSPPVCSPGRSRRGRRVAAPGARDPSRPTLATDSLSGSPRRWRCSPACRAAAPRSPPLVRAASHAQTPTGCRGASGLPVIAAAALLQGSARPRRHAARAGTRRWRRAPPVRFSRRSRARERSAPSAEPRCYRPARPTVSRWRRL